MKLVQTEALLRILWHFFDFLNTVFSFCTGCLFCILVKVAIVLLYCAAAWYCSCFLQDPHMWDKSEKV